MTRTLPAQDYSLLPKRRGATHVFFGSQFGDREEGRDVCAEDENPGLSQPRRSQGSFFQDFFSGARTTMATDFVGGGWTDG